MEEAASSPVRVVIIDDQWMFGESLAGLLRLDHDIDVRGIARTGLEGLGMVAEEEPLVVLIDHQMPGENGIAVTLEIKRRWPDTMVVMLTASDDDRVLAGAIEAGCSGFLTKDRAVAEVVTAVHTVAAGEALISPALLARLLPQLRKAPAPPGTQLTPRELDLLRLISRGCTNKAIAAELHLSVNTVRNYVQGILTKLGAHSKLEAVSLAVREGLMDYPTA